MRYFIFALLFFLAVLLPVQAVSATFVNISASGDAVISQQAPNTNYGHNIALTVGKTAGGKYFFTYLNFSGYISQLPADTSTIEDATLIIHASSTSGNWLNNSNAYSTSQFGETTITWNNKPALGVLINTTAIGSSGNKSFDITGIVKQQYASLDSNLYIALTPSADVANGYTANFDSLDMEANVPYISINVSTRDVHYNASLNFSDLMVNTMTVGAMYRSTNESSDVLNVTAGLTGAKILDYHIDWNMWEHSNATDSSENWAGFNWDTGREVGSDLVNRNSTIDRFIQTAKATNPAEPPILVIRLLSSPFWLRNDTANWYPLNDTNDQKYAFKMLLKRIVSNNSYPANKVILMPVGEPDESNTTDSYLDSIDRTMQAARDAANEVNTDIRIACCETWYTEWIRAYLARNPNKGNIDMIAVFGIGNKNLWTLGGARSVNNAEWDEATFAGIISKEQQIRDNLSVNGVSIKDIWLSEVQDKNLYYSKVGQTPTYGIFDTQNSALWIAASATVYSQQDWNYTTYTFNPALAYGENNTPGTYLYGWVGGGVIDHISQNNTEYPSYYALKEVYNLSGYTSIKNSSINYSEGIFVGGYKKDDYKIIMVNHRGPANVTINITGMDSSVNRIKQVNMLTGNTISYSKYTINTTYTPTYSATLMILDADTTPPASITNPQTAAGSYWINNTWTNPADEDIDLIWFKYSNGTTLANVSASAGYYNISWGTPAYAQSISAQTVDAAGNTNSTLVWFNATTPISTSTISCSGWCYLMMNYTNKTLDELDTRFSNDTIQGWFNATSQKYEFHHTGYLPNKNVSVSQKWGYYIYFNRSTDIAETVTGSANITLLPGWNLVGNYNSSARNLSALKTSIGANATQAQYYNRTSKAWKTGDSTSVPPGEAFFAYVTSQTNWGD